MGMRYDTFSRKYVDDTNYDPNTGQTRASPPAFNQQPPAPAAPAGSGNTFIRRTSSNKNVSDLINPIYGSESGGSGDYVGQINQGYENLGQPGQGPGRDEVARAATEALASSFADKVLQMTGSLPSVEQVRSFVGDQLNTGFAQKFIQGIPPDQINGMADQYLRGNPDALTNPGTQSAESQRIMGLSAQLDKLYGAGKQNLVSGYDETVYNPAKTRSANDLAGQGMLTNPNSRYNLNQVESNRGRDLSSGLTQLEGQRAQGNVDLSKTIEDLLQKNADRSQAGYQFNKNFNANQENTAFNQGLQRRSFDIASQLGRLQAQGQQNNGLSGALGGATSGATIGATAGGPWGALAGGIAGAGIGYFGSKR